MRTRHRWRSGEAHMGGMNRSCSARQPIVVRIWLLVLAILLVRNPLVSRCMTWIPAVAPVDLNH